MKAKIAFSIFLFLSAALLEAADDCPFSRESLRNALNHTYSTLCEYNKNSILNACCANMENNLNTLSECRMPEGCGAVAYDKIADKVLIQLWNMGLSVLPSGVFDYDNYLSSIDLAVNRFSSISPDAFVGCDSVTTLKCQSCYITSFPTGLFAPLTNLALLNLEFNSLESPFEEIRSLKNVQVLNISSCGATVIPENAFSGLSKLKSLRLDFSGITKIEPNAFAGTGCLEYINLVGNSLTSLGDNSFSGLSELFFLDLRANSISSISSSAFSNTPKLFSLFLYGNQLSSVPEDVFITSAVEQIEFTYNKFTRVPGKIGKTNRRYILYLAGNQIKTIEKDDFEPGNNLVALHMEDNSLSTISPGAFEYLGNLLNLVVPGNSLSSFPENLFVPCKKLVSLDLHQNGFKSIDKNTFKNLENLKSLDIGFNPLNSLGFDAFGSLYSLHTLGVSHLNLTFIPENLFLPLKDIVSIDLSLNELTELPQSCFENLKSLSVLSLNNNKITTIPQSAFAGTNGFTKLDLNQNCLDCSKYTAFGSVLCDENTEIYCPLPTCLRERIWEGCYECANKDEGAPCLTCNYGFEIKDDSCVLCGENIFCPTNSTTHEAGCEQFTRDNCTRCKGGYSWKDGHCYKKPTNNTPVIIAIVVVLVVLIVIIIVVVIIVLRRKDKKRRIQQLNQASVSSSSSTAKPLLNTGKSSGIAMQPLFGKFKNLILSETPFESGVFGALYLADLDGTQTIVRVVSNVSDSGKTELKKNIEKFSKMNDACLIKYLGVAEVSTNQEIVMEYIGGKSLKLASRSPDNALSPDLMRRCLKDISYAMSYLHSRNIVHKFLRLYNVILMDNADESSVGPVIRIAEYGLGHSVLLAEEEDAMSVDPKEAFYNAPELLDESESESIKTDIYSFGVLIADLWNKGDFTIDSDFKSRAAFNDGVITQGLRPYIDDACPEDLQKLAVACWQKDSSRRPTFNKIIASFF